MSRRRGAFAVVAIILALVVILALSQPKADPYLRPPLDPRGTGPDSTAALVELLRQEGANVQLDGLPQSSDDVVIQLRDTFSGQPARQLDSWIRNGGTLLTTDPKSTYAPKVNEDSTSGPTIAAGVCDVTLLRRFSRLGVDVQPVFPRQPGHSGCFGDRQNSWLDVHRVGKGTVIATGSLTPFQNSNLGDGSSADLAVTLVGPQRNITVRVLDPLHLVGTGQDVGNGSLLGALSGRGRQAFLGLVIAFGLWGLSQARRLGKPVPEDLPVPLPASDLVLSLGELLARRQDPQDAALRLRREMARSLGPRFGMGPNPPPEHLAHSLRNSGIDEDLVESAVLKPVFTETDLVQLAQDLDLLTGAFNAATTA